MNQQENDYPEHSLIKYFALFIVGYFVLTTLFPGEEYDEYIEPTSPLTLASDVSDGVVHIASPTDYDIVIPTDEKTCLAQVLFTETDHYVEMVSVGWSVRNRVEAEYRGSDYCEVAFWPDQFTGLNAPKGVRNTAANRTNYRTAMAMPRMAENWAWAPEGDYRRRAAMRWEFALQLAELVMDADARLNPVPGALWYWSPVAGIRMPNWATGIPATYTIRQEGTKILRFAFYTKVNGESGPDFVTGP